jgi:hypothetical protein
MHHHGVMIPVRKPVKGEAMEEAWSRDTSG